jgi:hypothetical protein
MIIEEINRESRCISGTLDDNYAALEYKCSAQAELIASLQASLKESEERVAGLLGENKRLLGHCFKSGLMSKAPCFNCGYNGPGYFNPETHPCAKFHDE